MHHLKNHPYRRPVLTISLPGVFSLLVLFLGLPPTTLAQQGNPCGSPVTNPTLTLSEATTAKPALSAQTIDPQLGGCVTRITDAGGLGSGEAVPIYSQLQAWNADHTKVLLQDGTILNTTDWSVQGTIPSRSHRRWSATRPTIIYTYGGTTGTLNNFDAYDVMTGTFSTVHVFSEYTSLLPDINPDQGYEDVEVASNGQEYVALAGQKATGGEDIFWFNITTNTKSTTVINGLQTVDCGSGPFLNTPEWVAMSPKADYLLIQWQVGGQNPGCAIDAYAMPTLTRLGVVATGHGHGDAVVDSTGQQWYVHYSPDDYIIGGPVLRKNRIPTGHDDFGTGDPTALVDLWTFKDPQGQPYWGHNMHISCRAHSVEWCVVSTYNTSAGETDGVQAFEKEVFQVYLDSTDATPHLRRLAQSRSDYAGCGENYWTQPHATSNKIGTHILYGSSWGAQGGCSPDSFVLTLSQAGSDTTPPSTPTGLIVQ